jgi:protein-disulfide isomerase
MPQLKPPVGPHDHIIGPHNARVTLVEYGDYQCPYCGNAHPIVKALQDKFSRTMRFVFRNFPLVQAHEFAMGAAEIAEAAGNQGKFWEMHDWLYAHQRTLEPEMLLKGAAQLQLDTDQIKAALEDGELNKRIEYDLNGGTESGVDGTPAFFINGKKFDGNWTDFKVFATAIEAAGG